MREIIYLVADRQGVLKMTKNLPRLDRGQIPIKVDVQVDPAAYGPPVIEMKLHVRDWREGLSMPDPEMREMVITEAEAEQIRKQRLAKMTEMLIARGYTVVAPVPDDGEGEDAEMG